jgi:hypothetical protein
MPDRPALWPTGGRPAHSRAPSLTQLARPTDRWMRGSKRPAERSQRPGGREQLENESDAQSEGPRWYCRGLTWPRAPQPSTSITPKPAGSWRVHREGGSGSECIRSTQKGFNCRYCNPLTLLVSVKLAGCCNLSKNVVPVVFGPVIKKRYWHAVSLPPQKISFHCI